MKVVNKQVSVHPAQQRFMNSKATYRAFVGGIGSGKSYAGALDMICRAKPGRLYLVTAPTYPMLSDATLRSFIDMAHMLGCVSPADIKRAPPPSVKLRTGAEVLFRSTDHPEFLRGPNISGIWMDEAGLSKKESFDILIGRLREGGEQGWLSATFTPKGRVHWTYKRFGTGRHDTDLIHARSEDNPFLPQGFVAGLREQYSERQSQQEISGLFVEGGGSHYFPHTWPRYQDTGDAYRVRNGDQWRHIRKDDCVRLLALDWAMGKPKKDAREKEMALGQDELSGDCTAFVVADMTDDADGLLFPLWAMCERVPLASNAPRLAEACRHWKPGIVSSDDDNLSETMLLECRRYRDIPSVKPIPIASRNKVTRSQAAIVRAERGKIYLPERPAPWADMVADYMAAFTGIDGEPDDIADCFSILGRLADEFKPGEDTSGDVDPILGAAGYDSAAAGWGDGGGW